MQRFLSDEKFGQIVKFWLLFITLPMIVVLMLPEIGYSSKYSRQSVYENVIDDPGFNAWLAVRGKGGTKRYQDLSPEDRQKKLEEWLLLPPDRKQKYRNDWKKMSPQERDRYQKLDEQWQRLSPEDQWKLKNWDKLSPQERKELRQRLRGK